MTVTLKGGPRRGSVTVPASKSQAHRALICAALSRNESKLKIDGFSKDILATIDCLNALGAKIEKSGDGCVIKPISKVTEGEVILRCGESGSTLRFLIPVLGALGAKAVFIMEGRLPERPLGALTDELKQKGMAIRQEGDKLYCSGKLISSKYTIPGNVSSQFISGLLFALPLLEGDSSLTITGEIESKGYISMTEDAVTRAGIDLEKTASGYHIRGGQKYLGSQSTVEADWSNAAFFLCMGALSKGGITVRNLNLSSLQGDRGIIEILKGFGADVSLGESSVTVKHAALSGQVIDASAIPDLVPTISALASVCAGETRIINAGRLRIKESDRLATTRETLSALGADITETRDGLVILGKAQLSGGRVDSHNDHRIAMAASVAACACSGSVTIDGAECVAKSYPNFFEHFDALEADI